MGVGCVCVSVCVGYTSVKLCSISNVELIAKSKSFVWMACALRGTRSRMRVEESKKVGKAAEAKRRLCASSAFSPVTFTILYLVPLFIQFHRPTRPCLFQFQLNKIKSNVCTFVGIVGTCATDACE